MSIFISLEIVILSMLIMLLLQLVPGVFALFIHHASGKYSKTKVDRLSIFFILGAETMLAFFLLSLNIILFALPYHWLNFNNPVFALIISGILIAESLSFFLFYYRKGKGTKLFISRKISTNLIEKSRTIKTPSDAFVLGFISTVPELIFTFPIYLVFLLSAYSLNSSAIPYAALIILFILVSVCPLFFTHGFFRTDHNLANFEKFRIKNKNFFRILTSLLYILIAITIIIFWVLH